ncbi:MAG: hypothetical protein Q7L55_00300 [Actinomycetota bacterium]|nr:hypothetical protein [Actinomycetota bacterium]
MADQAPGKQPAVNKGFGRILIVVYALFALAASSRAAVQIATEFASAPVAFTLSAFAALIYVVATIALARADQTSRTVATIAIGIELAGVLTIGLISLLVPSDFPKATVWSSFGSGYGFIPLVLPFVGLWWLRHTRPATYS